VKDLLGIKGDLGANALQDDRVRNAAVMVANNRTIKGLESTIANLGVAAYDGKIQAMAQALKLENAKLAYDAAMQQRPEVTASVRTIPRTSYGGMSEAKKREAYAQAAKIYNMSPDAVGAAESAANVAAIKADGGGNATAQIGTIPSADGKPTTVTLVTQGDKEGARSIREKQTYIDGVTRDLARFEILAKEPFKNAKQLASLGRDIQSARSQLKGANSPGELENKPWEDLGSFSTSAINGMGMSGNLKRTIDQIKGQIKDVQKNFADQHYVGGAKALGIQ